MNIYHITYSAGPRIACLFFRGCNMSCLACLLKKEIFDCHSGSSQEFQEDVQS